MIDINTLKEFGEKLMDRAKTELSICNVVAPVLIVVKNGGKDVETVEVPMANEREMSEVKGLLKRKASEPGTEAMVFFMDALTKDLDENEAIPETLRGDKDAVDVLYLAVFRPEGTCLHQVIYSKGEHGPAFLDLGWEEIEEHDGPMASPWLKIGVDTED